MLKWSSRRCGTRWGGDRERIPKNGKEVVVTSYRLVNIQLEGTGLEMVPADLVEAWSTSQCDRSKITPLS